MLSRVTGFKLGWLRAEIDVRPSAWFFQAHFYQDPVQPGSLGIEALLQVLQFYVIHSSLAEGIADPVFVPDGGLCWKYRGQVVPANQLVTVEVKVHEMQRSADSCTMRAEGWLFVDGRLIYHCTDFGAKVVRRPSYE
jgi:3-hydroxymyristoyl/3-hydroxydecanoyl-(acyl carrier protein) dehydratase